MEKIAQSAVKSQGLTHQEYRPARITENSLRSYLRRYREGDKERPRRLNFARPQSELADHRKALEEKRETDMTAPISPADNATTSTRELSARLYSEITANRKGTRVPTGSPGDLDFTRAAETIVRCAGNAGLSPTLAFAEAEDLARAFVDGDDGPFARYSDGRSLPPTEESDLGVDEVLVLCALLAAREQWAREACIVELPASRSAEADAVCPACGSMARLEILLGEFSERYAVCPACDALWRIPRIGCPHCSQSDGRHLVVYSTEGRTDRALVYCLVCRRVWRRLYLKDRTAPPDDLFIRAFESWPEELLLDQCDDLLPVPLRPLHGTLDPQ